MPIADPTAYCAADATELNLAAILWRAVGEGQEFRSVLATVVRIGGADLHLHAIQVLECGDEQCGAPGAEEAYDCLNEFDGRDGNFETVSIEGRRYALQLVPFRIR